MLVAEEDVGRAVCWAASQLEHDLAQARLGAPAPDQAADKRTGQITAGREICVCGSMGMLPPHHALSTCRGELSTGQKCTSLGRMLRGSPRA